jgi:pimeloyl-ACP methyl ester carboxylesterase
MSPVEGFVEVDGRRLHHLLWPGDPEATPLVLVHGINVQAHTWDPIAAALSTQRQVFAVDLRGHGDSDWAKDGYQLRSFVSDLVAVAASLGIERAAWLGHSLGARITIALAGMHPELTAALLLSDTGPEVPRSGAEFSRAIVSSTREVRGFSSAHEALEHFRALHPEWRADFHDLHVAHQLRLNWAGKLVFKSDPDLFWLTGSSGSAENPFLWDMLAAVTSPALLVWGSRSGFFDADLLERMRVACPQLVEVCLDSGHYVPREQPEQFTQTVRGFLDQTEAT